MKHHIFRHRRLQNGSLYSITKDYYFSERWRFCFIIRNWNCFHCLIILTLFLLLYFSLHHFVDLRFFRKHFSLLYYYHRCSKITSKKFCDSFLYLPLTFFVVWFWRNMYVRFQTLTNALNFMPLKWTNAIRMHLALILRAHTTVPVILNTLGMVLSVKVRLVFTMPSN